MFLDLFSIKIVVLKTFFHKEIPGNIIIRVKPEDFHLITDPKNPGMDREMIRYPETWDRNP